MLGGGGPQRFARKRARLKLRVFDRFTAPTEHCACTLELPPLPHIVTVQLDTPGMHTPRLIGRRNNQSHDLTVVERQITRGCQINRRG